MSDLISRQAVKEEIRRLLSNHTKRVAVRKRQLRRLRMKCEINECKRNNLCVDCDNTRCHFHGKKEADCPKWKCDRPGGRDCEHCEFIDDFIEQMREKHLDDFDRSGEEWR